MINTNEYFSVVSQISATCLPKFVPTGSDYYGVKTCLHRFGLCEKVWIAWIILYLWVKHYFVFRANNQGIDSYLNMRIKELSYATQDISLLITVNSKRFIRELILFTKFNSEEGYAWEFRLVEINH
jgi:hypothetical protein